MRCYIRRRGARGDRQSAYSPIRAREPGYPEIARLDLGGGRQWLRVALPAAKIANRVDVRIGIRRQRECVDLRQVMRAPSGNPLRLQGIVLAALLYIYRVSQTTTVSTVTDEYIEAGRPHSPPLDCCL